MQTPSGNNQPDDERDVKSVVRRMAGYGSDYHEGPRSKRAKRDAVGAVLSRNGGRVLAICTAVFGMLSIAYCLSVPFFVATFSSPWIAFLLIPALVVPALPWGMLFLAKVTRKYEE